MIAPSTDTLSDSLDLATEGLYRFLAAAWTEPRDLDAGARLAANRPFVVAAADFLRAEFGAHSVSLGFGEAPVDDLDARALFEELQLASCDLSAEYVRVFGFLSCRECPPYEAEYHANSDTFFRMQQVADVAGFYRAFGLSPGSDARERPDLLSLELEFLAFLLMKQRLAACGTAARISASATTREVCLDARRAFFRDHVTWWMPSFCLALRRKAERGPYAAAGRLLAALLAVDRTRLGISPSRNPKTASVEEPSDSCAGCQLAN